MASPEELKAPVTLEAETRLTLALAGTVLVIIFWCGYFYRDVSAKFEVAQSQAAKIGEISDLKNLEVTRRLDKLSDNQKQSNEILTQIRIELQSHRTHKTYPNQ